MNFINEPHCALIVGKTNSGKTKWILDLLEGAYKNVFETIIIICPTLRKNKTYLARKWIFSDDNVFLCDIEKERLTINQAIDLYRELFEGINVLFIVDDCSSEQEIKYRKKTCALSKMAFSGRHYNHSCWLLTQKYNSVLKDYRENTAWLALFYCKDKKSFDQALDENDVVPLEMRAEIKQHLRDLKFSKLIVKTEPPVCYNAS